MWRKSRKNKYDYSAGNRNCKWMTTPSRLLYYWNGYLNPRNQGRCLIVCTLFQIGNVVIVIGLANLNPRDKIVQFECLQRKKWETNWNERESSDKHVLNDKRFRWKWNMQCYAFIWWTNQANAYSRNEREKNWSCRYISLLSNVNRTSSQRSTCVISFTYFHDRV